MFLAELVLVFASVSIDRGPGQDIYFHRLGIYDWCTHPLSIEFVKGLKST